MADEMTIDEFGKTVHQDVDNFVRWWKLNMQRDPEMFPGSMAEGELWEQFIAADHGEIKDELDAEDRRQARAEPSQPG